MIPQSLIVGSSSVLAVLTTFLNSAELRIVTRRGRIVTIIVRVQNIFQKDQDSQVVKVVIRIVRMVRMIVQTILRIVLCLER